MTAKKSSFLRKMAISGAIFFVFGEIVCRLLGYSGHEYQIKATPTNVFEKDDDVAWKLNPGRYHFSVRTDSNLFDATINNERNRITSLKDDETTMNERRPVVQVYGCSYTFGFSVSDTATSCFKLQTMLPGFKIENKGVPGYGLTQMFLALKKSLVAKDTPVIAVFNYGDFQDMRTPLHKGFTSLLVKAITGGYSKRFKEMRYPYMTYADDSLTLNYCPLNELSRFWPLHKYSAFVALVNDVFYYQHDKKNTDYLKLISQKTAIHIMQYCQSNHIIPIFATVTPESKDIIELVARKGYYTINYGIKVNDYNIKKENTIYNCGPADPDHPSGLSHTIYAQKIYSLIHDSILPTSKKF